MNSMRSGFYLKNLLYLALAPLMISCFFSASLYWNLMGSKVFAFLNARKPMLTFSLSFTNTGHLKSDITLTFKFSIWKFQIPRIYLICYFLPTELRYGVVFRHRLASIDVVEELKQLWFVLSHLFGRSPFPERFLFRSNVVIWVFNCLFVSWSFIPSSSWRLTSLFLISDKTGLTRIVLMCLLYLLNLLKQLYIVMIIIIR